MYKLLLVLAGGAAMFASCRPGSGRSANNINCDSVVCTMMMESITVQVTDKVGEPVTLDEVYTLGSSGEKIRLEQAGASEGLYVVLDDSYQKKLVNKTEDFTLVGMRNGAKVVNEKYRISADCCHVKKVSGKDVVETGSE